jgi:putative transposase
MPDRPGHHRHRFPAEIIAHAVWLYHRFALSLRDVEELRFERGVAVTYEAIRTWVVKFGAEYAAELRKREARPGRRWHLDEVFPRVRALPYGVQPLPRPPPCPPALAYRRCAPRR